MTAGSAVVGATVEIVAAVDVEMTVAIVTAGGTKAEADVAEAAAEAVANGMIRSATIVAVLANPTEAAAVAEVSVAAVAEVSVAAVAEVSVVAVAVQMVEIQKLARAAVGKMTEAVVMIGAIVTTAEMPKAILRTRMLETVVVAAEVVAVADHALTKARATVVTSKAADKAVIDGLSCSKSELQAPSLHSSLSFAAVFVFTVEPMTVKHVGKHDVLWTTNLEDVLVLDPNEHQVLDLNSLYSSS
jgi:hypothetical protein